MRGLSEDWVGIVVGGFQRRASRKFEGTIDPKGREYEIDLYIADGESLILKKLNLKSAKKAIITLEKHPSFVRFCEQMGIEVG